MELMKETKVWRVDTEKEAIDKINACKDAAITEGYTVTKSGYTMKVKKSKGEIIDSFFLVDITFTYDL